MNPKRTILLMALVAVSLIAVACAGDSGDVIQFGDDGGISVIVFRSS